MGRKKIQISRIQDERNRQITFSKRKAGLLKKAYELSVLCDVEVAVIMISSNNKLYQYASSNMNSILIRYTEFKDPDESKTNADILEDITRKEKGGHGGDEDGEEDEDTRQYMATDHGPTAYHRLSEEFDLLDRTASIQQAHASSQPPPVLISPRVPQAMPVSIPVPSSSSPRIAQRVLPQLGSAGSTGSSSTGTPFSPDTTSSISPASTGSGSIMPPPTGTPTRLQTIRNQTLKLHLPGSGRHYISLGAGGGSEKKSPAPDDPGGRTGDSSSDGAAAPTSSSRPQLRVVLPGQKGFVYRSAPSSPPPMVGMDNTVAASSSTAIPSVTGATTNTVASLNPVSTSMESLTTPVVSLSTPNLFNSLSPLLSSLTSELPLGSAGVGDSAASALVAFPVSIQSTPGASKGQTSGSNIVLQAQNMGQPFLLAPSSYENKQQLQGGTFPFTPSSNAGLGLSPPLIRDLEQLKHQYDRIYQQISQTLHHHQLHQQHSQKDKDDDEDEPPSPSTAAGNETVSEPPDGEQESVAKRPRLTTNS